MKTWTKIFIMAGFLLLSVGSCKLDFIDQHHAPPVQVTAVNYESLFSLKCQST